MEIKHKNWNEVSIDMYYRILDITDDDSLSDVEKDLAICALLCDVPEEDIYSLSVIEAGELLDQMRWLAKFDFNQKFKGGAIKIQDEEYWVEVDLHKMTIAQYIDFQTFYKPDRLREYYGNLLACFIVPKGKKYGEGYDVAELSRSLRQNLSIVVANEILFFFLKELQTSIRALQIYLDWLMRRLMRKTQNLEKQAQIRALMDKIEEMNHLLMVGSVWSRNTVISQK